MKKLLFKRFMLLGVLSLGLFTACDEDEGSVEPLIPVITSISPESGEPGDEVIIAGRDLNEATSVSFGGVSATVTSNTATEIKTTVPEGASTGKISVVTAGGTAISTADFEVIVIGAATVTSVSRISSQVGGSVTLTGTEMATVSSISVGGVEATVVSATDTEVEITVGDSPLGLSTITVVNEGGSVTTSTEAIEFYVIRLIEERFRETFDSDNPDVIGMTGSADGEESVIHGISSEVVETAQDLPPAVDGNFFQMEGFSSMDFSGSYMAQLNLRTQEAGTFTETFGDAQPSEVYFNVQMNFGELPDGYKESELEDDLLAGLRIRSTATGSSDYEFRPTWIQLESLGFAPDENGWWDLSIPLDLFDDSFDISTLNFSEMTRYAISIRRNYGSGTELPLTAEQGAIYSTLSFDNVIISIGGPYSFE